MQNAKHKISALGSVEAFRLRESLFYGTGTWANDPQVIVSAKEIRYDLTVIPFLRTLILHFAFYILHFLPFADTAKGRSGRRGSRVAADHGASCSFPCWL